MYSFCSQPMSTFSLSIMIVYKVTLNDMHPFFTLFKSSGLNYYFKPILDFLKFFLIPKFILNQVPKASPKEIFSINYVNHFYPTGICTPNILQPISRGGKYVPLRIQASLGIVHPKKPFSKIQASDITSYEHEEKSFFLPQMFTVSETLTIKEENNQILHMLSLENKQIKLRCGLLSAAQF